MPAKRFDPVEGYIAGNNVRMRSAPTMSAPIVGEFSYGNALVIVGATDDWAAVICGSQPGYIYGQFVKVGSFGLTGSASSASSGSAGGLSGSSYEKGQQIAQYAVQFVGCPYSWGGKSPSGFDCSGLVYYVYKQFGIELSRVAQDQATDGVPVDPGDLQPGDILCFYSGSSYIGHAGIYIGFGKFVHAQNSATGVVITDLEGHYAERGFEARRIV
jgi:cell wall-associated NlpC family hydrolase